MNLPEIREEGLRLAASRWVLGAGGLGLLGLLLVAWQASTLEHGAAQFYRSYLVSFMYVLSLALGGLFFVIITHLVRAGWGVVLRRLAESLAWSLIPLALAGIVLLVGMHDLYEWSHAEAVAQDELLQHKSPFLNSTFFTVRYAVYFAIWIGLALYYGGTSRRQDQSGDHRLTIAMERVSAPAAILFALSVTFATVDWMMSLYPHWYSTIYGVYYFAGCVIGVFSLLALLVMALQRSGKLTEVVNVAHFHDVGKMMFAFVVFWAYIAFSQYMLIWYANIPEETEFYAARQHAGWIAVSVFLIFGHFFVPFLFLMSRHIKRRQWALGIGAVWLLLVHWVDLFYIVMPGFRTDGPRFALLDLGCLLLLLGFFLAAVFWRLSRAPLIPLGDPRLAESMGLESA